jgi:hypothetical protein
MNPAWQNAAALEAIAQLIGTTFKPLLKQAAFAVPTTFPNYTVVADSES